MDKEKICRISELTRLSHERPLTQAEQAERDALRQEYIQGYRANMEAVLCDVRVKEPDGTLRPLRKKSDLPQ